MEKVWQRSRRAMFDLVEEQPKLVPSVFTKLYQHPEPTASEVPAFELREDLPRSWLTQSHQLVKRSVLLGRVFQIIQQHDELLLADRLLAH